MRSELTSLDFSASFNRRRVQICSCSSWICSMLRPHNSQHCANIVTFSPGFRFFCSVSGCFCTFLELYRCNIFFTKNNCIAQSPDLCIWAARRASRSQGPWQATCGAQHVAMTFLFATGEWPWKPGVSGCGNTTNLPYCIIIIIIFNYAACCTSHLIPAKVHTVKVQCFLSILILLLHVDAPPTWKLLNSGKRSSCTETGKE